RFLGRGRSSSSASKSSASSASGRRWGLRTGRRGSSFVVFATGSLGSARGMESRGGASSTTSQPSSSAGGDVGGAKTWLHCGQRTFFPAGIGFTGLRGEWQFGARKLIGSNGD